MIKNRATTMKNDEQEGKKKTMKILKTREKRQWKMMKKRGKNNEN